MSMSNLLTETLNDMAINGKFPEDVWWVGSAAGAFAVSWDDFISIADLEYNNGYGEQKIASDLIVVGDSWWLERYEYDGSEGWSFKTFPMLQPTAMTFAAVGQGAWDSIATLNKGVEGEPVTMNSEAYSGKTSGTKPVLAGKPLIVPVEPTGRRFRIVASNGTDIDTNTGTNTNESKESENNS